MTEDSSSGSRPPSSSPLQHPRLGVATSLSAARPGEVVYVTRGGGVMTARRVRALKTWSWVGASALIAFLGVTYGRMFSPVLGVATISVLGGLLTWRWRKARALESAMALMSLGRWEEAGTALGALDRGWLPRGLRPTVRMSLASVTSGPNACVVISRNLRESPAKYARYFPSGDQTGGAPLM